MSTEMTIVLTIAYFLFWVWGSSRKAQVSATPSQTDCNYINYFPESEPEEEELIKEDSSFVADPSSIPIEVEFDYYAFTGMVELMSVSVTATDVRHLATQAAVIDDPWTLEVEPIELEFNVVQLEYQLALPPAPVEPVIKTVIDYAGMTIRQLKKEASKAGIKRYSTMRKAQLIELLSQQ